MAYIKYKEITKYFYFSKALTKESLPKYVFDYLFDDETVLASYKTLRDHGIFTDRKIVLFDSKVALDNSKEIFTIPYETISTVSVAFRSNSADMSLFLLSGYPLRIKFVKMSDSDKLRLRILYNVIQQIICKDKPSKDKIDMLVNNTFNFD